MEYAGGAIALLLFGGLAVYAVGVIGVFFYCLTRLGRPYGDYADVCLWLALGWPQSLVGNVFGWLGRL